MVISFVSIFMALAIFGALHTLFASTWMKALTEKRLGLFARRFYRLFYNLVSIFTLGVVVWMVFRLPDKGLYTISAPFVFFTFFIQFISALSTLAALAQTGIKSLLGFEPLFQVEKKVSPKSLTLNGFYRWLRHPAYTFGLLFLWLMPWMTVNLLAFNLASTFYILVGIYFEERKLLSEFGEAYDTYRRKTPMLIPPFLIFK